ncbi:MAG TPA: GNAT family N-acetyltransferase [Alphaproteobacteria bacterium]|nr:GNAT family N-acetyltransferase [Alphaproteobacteria bacterium]
MLAQRVSSLAERPTIIRMDGSADLSECYKLRRAVFVEEQQVAPAEDTDGTDPLYTHYLMRFEHKPVATARARILENGDGKIGRFCVLKECRGKGLGLQFLLHILEDMKRDKKLKKVTLSAQTQAIPFYEKAQFRAYGKEYMDARIPHYDMVLEVQ